MRKSTLFLSFLTVCIGLLVLIFAHASVQVKAEEASFRANADLVGKLDLTDLCLFTEASYTRHLSQAHLLTPFQNGPMSLEHFPSGSLVTPPMVIRKINGKVD
ncbi:MAG TPA: hypothetical protein VMB77_04665 [Syntrophales bacterium]|nr:hypothetical protein [Syntrophales bacterium]